MSYLTQLSRKRIARIYYEIGRPDVKGMSESLLPLRRYLEYEGHILCFRPLTKEDVDHAPKEFVMMNKNHAVVVRKEKNAMRIIVDTTQRFYLENPETIMYVR